MNSLELQSLLAGHKPRTYLIDPSRRLRPAAVVLLWNEKTDHVVFTVRADHMRKHAGQISFPGGALDEGETPEQAAVREANEEIGVFPGDVRILGETDRFQSVSSYLVQCFVAAWTPSNPIVVNRAEISEVFEAPLSFFLDPRNCRKELWSRTNVQREMFLWHWENHVIWGLTARFLASLVSIVIGEELTKRVGLSESTQVQFEKLPTYFTDSD